MCLLQSLFFKTRTAKKKRKIQVPSTEETAQLVALCEEFIDGEVVFVHSNKNLNNNNNNTIFPRGGLNFLSKVK